MFADCGNNRVLRFRQDGSVGEVLTWNGFPLGIGLSCPTDVILDADGVVYISDSGNHRIIRWQEKSSQCIIGCQQQGNSQAADTLRLPQQIEFDHHGNLFVVDSNKTRVQKFKFDSTSCGKLFENQKIFQLIQVSEFLKST